MGGIQVRPLNMNPKMVSAIFWLRTACDILNGLNDVIWRCTPSCGQVTRYAMFGFETGHAVNGLRRPVHRANTNSTVRVNVDESGANPTAGGRNFGSVRI
jgi:hypothetical protein